MLAWLIARTSRASSGSSPPTPLAISSSRKANDRPASNRSRRIIDWSTLSAREFTTPIKAGPGPNFNPGENRKRSRGDSLGRTGHPERRPGPDQRQRDHGGEDPEGCAPRAGVGKTAREPDQ